MDVLYFVVRIRVFKWGRESIRGYSIDRLALNSKVYPFMCQFSSYATGLKSKQDKVLHFIDGTVVSSCLSDLVNI
jgi:hypothetical protein